jgi:type IV pilus assembly protein PilM
MANKNLFTKWGHRLSEPAYPNVGIEVNSDCVRLAAISAKGGSIHVEHLDSMPIPAGTVQINPFKSNILELEPVARVLKDLWSRVRQHPPKICLLLQDRCALTFLVNLETQPENREECTELLRFKLKKNIPFRAEEAHITYFQDTGTPDYRAANLWVTVVNSHVLQQYEAIIRSAIGSDSGLVDLCTFNLMNLAHQEIQHQKWQEEDHLYVNLNRDYISLAITQRDRLVFYRSREMEHHDGMIQEAMEEIHPAVMFYQDKLSGSGFSRTFVYAFEAADELCRTLEQTHSMKSVLLNPASGARDARIFAPLLGLLMSRKPEFL